MLAVQNRTPALRGVSRTTLAVALVASGGGLSFALLQGWPVWADGAAAVALWLPILTADTIRVYRRHHWLALFYVLVVTQTGHLIEHIAQMIQIHVLGLSGAEAQGVFGVFNVEVVHFVWNTWVIVAALVLLGRFPANVWLTVTVGLSGWHEVEHAVIFWTYLMTGLSGTPGLLSQGGLIVGGLPISRPDLHFLYNLFETVALYAAFISEVLQLSINGSRRTGCGKPP